MSASLVFDSQVNKHTYRPHTIHDKFRPSPIQKGCGLIISAITWPIFAILAPVFLAHNINKYVKSSLKQAKLIKILHDDNQFQLYSAASLNECDKKIERLKQEATDAITDHLKNNNGSPFGGTRKIEFLLEYIELPAASEPAEREGNRLLNTYWGNLNWDDYLAKDFKEVKNKARGCDREICQTLRTIQIKYQTVMRQKAILIGGDDGKKSEMIRQNAELSFVKNSIKKQINRQDLLSLNPLLWMIPTGFFWYILQGPRDDMALFKDKSKHLSAVPTLNKYKDLVDAHDGLIENRDYLTPYLKNISFRGW